MTAFVIFNPNSAGGRTGREWREIEEALEKIFPLMSFFVTTAPGQAAHMVRDALQDGHLEIIAVGGDGTINEALNGFFHHGSAVAPDAVFNFVHSGDDSAFCRRFGMAPGWRAGVAHLSQARIHKTDIGRVSCLSADGVPLTRYFLGEASFGFSAKLAASLGRARITRLFGNRFAQSLYGFLARARWRGTRVRLMADNYDEIAGIASVALSPARGLFDMRLLDTKSRPDDSRSLRTLRLTAAPTLDTTSAVEVECDGESAGILPASFDIYPAAINLRI
jgi:diacylglycerol kinase family enzyme